MIINKHKWIWKVKKARCLVQTNLELNPEVASVNKVDNLRIEGNQ